MKKLFVSFSVSGDAAGRHFVRSLLRRLNEQSIDAWIYESPGGRIRSGASIALACRQKIDESDVFVLVVNDQALVSDFVAMEVSHALWLRRQRELVIYPIVSTALPRSHWPPHITEALGFKGVQKDLTDAAMEDVVYDICLCLAIDYSPPAPVVARLPLAKRLADELTQHRSATAYDAQDFRRLLQKCELACLALTNDEYAKAFDLAKSILVDLEIDYGITKPYYPRIFMGATLLRQAASGLVPHEHVRSFFAELITEGGERLDGNAYVGRAHALLALHRYAEALADYRLAEAHLDRPDPALLYNIARVQVLSGAGLSTEELRRWREGIAEGMLTTEAGDLSKVASVLALGHAHRGEASMAESAWEIIADHSDVFPELLAEICHWLRHNAHRSHDVASLRIACRMLDDYLSTPGEDFSATLAHVRARVRFDLGARTAARNDMDALMKRCPTNPLFSIDAAMFALEDADTDVARQLCINTTEIHDHNACWPTLSVGEFNLVIGQAFWLLGLEAPARESFRRSSRPPSLWYLETMPEAFGAVAPRGTAVSLPCTIAIDVPGAS